MRKLGSILIALAAATSANAQPVPADVAVPQMPVSSTAPPPACCVVPASTGIVIEFLETVNSQANKIGDKFRFKLQKPLIIDGEELIPAGAEGSGDVIHAAKSRFGGKPGELLMAVRYITHDGQQIPVRGLRFDYTQGQDQGNLAAAINVAVGPLGMFITGGEVNVPAGTLATAKITKEMVLPPVKAPAAAPQIVQQESK
jgi:hypothetical protein